MIVILSLFWVSCNGLDEDPKAQFVVSNLIFGAYDTPPEDLYARETFGGLIPGTLVEYQNVKVENNLGIFLKFKYPKNLNETKVDSPDDGREEHLDYEIESLVEGQEFYIHFSEAFAKLLIYKNQTDDFQPLFKGYRQGYRIIDPGMKIGPEFNRVTLNEGDKIFVIGVLTSYADPDNPSLNIYKSGIAASDVQYQNTVKYNELIKCAISDGYYDNLFYKAIKSGASYVIISDIAYYSSNKNIIEEAGNIEDGKILQVVDDFRSIDDVEFCKVKLLGADSQESKITYWVKCYELKQQGVKVN